MGDLNKERESFQEEVKNKVGILGASTYAQNLLEILQKDLFNIDLSTKNWALVAVGGFGRGALSFASDLDLLFLYKNRLSKELKDFIQEFIYKLWDARFEVGHSVMPISEVRKLMSQDFSVKTSYLETRFVYGDKDFYEVWRQDLLRQGWIKQKRRFLSDILAYREKRLSKFGDSIYMLEPHLKEGLGGLRDLHSLRWIGSVFLNSAEFENMRQEEWISSTEKYWLEEAHDFIWRVRLQLHMLSDKKQDRLFLQDQNNIAYRLGFLDGAEEVHAVEAFMRLYYRHAARIRRVSSFLLERLEQELKPIRQRYKKKKILPGPFILQGNHIRFYEQEMVQNNPGLLMNVFWQAAKSGCHFHHETGQVIRQNLRFFSSDWRQQSNLIKQFFDILLDSQNAYSVLKVMMETGFLERFLPEFSLVRYKVQYDMYHLYTVDEHLLRTVMELHAFIENKRANISSDRVKSNYIFLYGNTELKILFLAALIHDIGKGQGKAHSLRGAELAEKIGNRLLLVAEDVDLLTSLVRNHLLLAETAMKRDLSDEKTVERCALQVGSLKRLNFLYLLTIADSKATGQQVWNNWKSSLLEELFYKVRHYLQGQNGQAEDLGKHVLEVYERIKEMVGDEKMACKVNNWLKGMSIRYILNQSPSDIVRHYCLEQGLEEDRVLQLEIRPQQGEMWKLDLVCYDQQRLFDYITGVLWANGLNVLSADIYTRDNKIAIDIIIIEEIPDPLHSEELWARIRKDLYQVLSNEISLDVYLDKKKPSSISKVKKMIHQEDKVVIDEQASDFYTVIEVYTWERPGVLHIISKTLHSFDLSIHMAKISTPGAQVVDVFYLTDQEGNKILDQALHEQLTKSLLQALSEN